MGYVESVNIATVRTGEWTGRMGSTGIDKRPVAGPLVVDDMGADGTGSGVRDDAVLDTAHHGGRDQAVYAYDSEELRFWAAALGKELPPGSVGENLTLTGCDSSHAVIGERWQIGTAVLRVTGPRIPCRVFAGFWELPELVKRFSAHGRPGSYFAVEQGGEIRTDDSVNQLSQPEHGVTVADYFAFRAQGRRDLADHVAASFADLPANFAKKVKAALSQ